MLNCCTERRLARAGTPVHPVAALETLSASGTPDQPDHAGTGSGGGLAQRMRAHVMGQLRRRSGEEHGPGAQLRIRRPIGRLLRTVRAGGGDGESDVSSAAPTVDIGEFEDICAYESDSEGFVSAEDDYISDGVGNGRDVGDSSGSSNALLLLDQASLNESSATPMRLPANARAPGTSARDANYIDVAVASSLDSTSGFHHVSDVYERDPPLDAASSSKASLAPSAKQPETDEGHGGGDSCGAGGQQNIDELGADERAGGLHESPTLRLLETGQPMWVPKIQAQPVLTEDMLREREAILMSFGTSAEGARQRAQVQCAELFSDMESFKAANPRCSLADFVRWHSPRDWVVPDGAAELDGALSVRMAGDGAGNLWHQLWAEARRVPADRQRLLFDDAVEAEKALHYLEGLPVHALFAALLPTTLLIAYERLYRQPVVHRVPLLRARLAALGARMAHRVDWAAVSPDSPVFGALLDDLEDLEVQTSRCVSLLAKFPAQYALVDAVVQNGRAAVTARDAQKVVLRALSRFDILSAAPARREYTFTADLAGAPQRMHVVIEDDRSIRVVYGRSQPPPS
ncbi:hypothetical protein IWQ57_003722 [Coemansia nantahalensis]|uniref:Uncharacterized protein n=1 Tax=Coemansia nantahalensis TaxID=2789366 RepID=A0ACC1JVI3_9FUNG|nr:hypothetical protein IWQ57_003722 [Coemansia nantahalensis]